jgi:hypothetical protein
MRLRVTLIAISALALVDAGPAAADDAGEAGTNGDSGVATGVPSPNATPIACDGALCDTTNGSECGVAGATVGNAHFDSIWLAALVAAMALGIERRARRGAPRPPLRSEPR